ncbi:MAG: glycosyltransferase family 4 protein [Anaerolineae bacterium]|nr:glycosyltransferase family 4 protein [Phycisphaerae bacterium]
MRIAIFDYKVVRNNPIGSCHLRLLEGLSSEHEFVVFANRFENPNPDRIKFIRVPVPTRPLALLFVAFHILAPIRYWIYRLSGGQKFDVIQSVESNCLLRMDIDYAHFCHRRFLKVHWPGLKSRGLRSVLRFWDHFLHSMLEPIVYRRARSVVVPSRGLQRELVDEFPNTAPKLSVLANPVRVDHMKRPADFDRSNVRRSLGLADDDVVLLFTALGHFERKGLPLLLEALASIKNPSLKLVVVGGESDLVRNYQTKITAMGLNGRVNFAGMQKDVRPYLWMADAFALPSAYEVFPLVVLEAAAAGVPIIVTPLNGVEEFCVDGVNGLVIERSAAGCRAGIERFAGMSADARAQLGRHAQQDVLKYSVEEFHANWRNIYERYKADAAAPRAATQRAAAVEVPADLAHPRTDFSHRL